MDQESNHSSDDDLVHSATLMDSTTYKRLGCVTYREDTRTFAFFPATGTFKECHVDKSGQWLLTFDTVNEVAVVQPDGTHTIALTSADGLEGPTSLALRGDTVPAWAQGTLCS